MNGIGTEIERRDRRRLLDSDFIHHLRCEPSYPFGCSDDAGGVAEYRLCCLAFDGTSCCLSPFAKEIAAIHIHQIGNAQLAIRPAYCVADGSNVPAMKHVEIW